MSLGALTTSFTPPTGRLASNENVYVTRPNTEWSYLVAGPIYTGDGSPCFPSGCNPDRSSYYSPGFCPEGYTPGYSSSGIIQGNVEETTVMCCPSVAGKSFFVDTRRKPFGFEEPFACKWQFDTLTTLVTFMLDGTTQSAAAFTARPSGALNTHGYHIRVRATDILTPFTGSTPTTTGPSSSTTSVPPPPEGSRSSDLSTSAAVGIGISATVVVLALGVVAFWFGRRKMLERKRREAEVAGNDIMEESATGAYGAGDKIYVPPGHEQTGKYIVGPVEMSASPLVGELDSREMANGGRQYGGAAEPGTGAPDGARRH